MKRKRTSSTKKETSQEEKSIETTANGICKDDPFICRFQRNLRKDMEESTKNPSNIESSFQIWENLGNIEISSLNIDMKPSSNQKIDIDDSKDDPLPPISPMIRCPNYPDLSHSFIRPRLQKKFLENANDSKISSLQSELLVILSNYLDLYYPESTFKKWDDVTSTYCLHILNHTLKSRHQIITNNNKANIKKMQNMDDAARDQGFNRPKVLILLPFKNSAYRVVKILMKLLFGNSKGTDVHNLKRFEEEFGPSNHESEIHSRRPEDFLHIFKGNINEDFKIGLSVTKKSLKLYADFYKSDIIIASPLGLCYTLGAPSDPQYDPDFLCSIEIFLLDQADILFMQNWEHVLVIRDNLNRPHKVQHMTTDINRIRYYFLDGLAQLYRQTVVFSSTNVDFHRALIKRSYNFSGKFQVSNQMPAEVETIGVNSKLYLHSVKGSNDAEARFNFFTKRLFSELRSLLQNHTLIYVSDYCDYLRLIHYFNSDGGTSVATINEYMVSKNAKVAKARTLFFEGKKAFLVYTERFHFYRRYRIKGVQHVIFYSLPTYPHFFSEICNMMIPENQNPREKELNGTNNIHVLFQHSDVSKLLYLIGAKKTSSLLNSEKANHMISLER